MHLQECLNVADIMTILNGFLTCLSSIDKCWLNYELGI